MSNVEDIIKKTQVKINESLENFKTTIAGISTKANPAIFNAIRVEVEGTLMAINHIASVSVSGAGGLTITAFQSSHAGLINKAIMAANLGLSLALEGAVIRASFPPITTERRKQMSSIIEKECENRKVSLRNIRRDANDEIKKRLKEKLISEDICKKGEAKIEAIIKEAEAKLKESAELKTKEIMTL